jgi:hypothetical protein
MNINRLSIAVLAVLSVLAVALTPGAAHAQNPIQWSSNPSRSIDRAAETALPILLWVQDSRNNNSDLDRAQRDSFRDPVVVGIVQQHFVPLQVSRNSRNIEKLSRLGLPTGFGMYCAVVTNDGRVITEIGPAEVAQPELFASVLNWAYARHIDELYQKKLRPVLTDPTSSKAMARRAAQVVWRLGIRQADGAIIGLLSREDVNASDKASLYQLLAALGTQASINTLLDRLDERTAVTALNNASPAALEWLTPALPTAEGEPTARQLAAYTAMARISRTTARAQSWWTRATPQDRQRELDRITSRAQTVVEFLREQQGGMAAPRAGEGGWP